MNKKLYKIIICSLVVLFILAMSTESVMALWNYKELSSDTSSSLNIYQWFEFGSDEDSLINKSTIDKIIGVDGDLQGSLNDPNSSLIEHIRRRHSYGNDSLANDSIAGSELKEDMQLDDVNFLLKFPKDDEDTMYLYTTSINLVRSGDAMNIPKGEYVAPVYRTRLVRENGVWRRMRTQEGYAKSAYYYDSMFGIITEKTPLFDEDTWVEGKIGANVDTPKYVFNGDNGIISNVADSVYLTTIATSQGYLTIHVEGEASITLYDENMQEIPAKINSTSDGTELTWRTYTRRRYYLKVDKNDEIKYKIMWNRVQLTS